VPNNVADSVKDGDPKTKYLALLENPSLLALTSGVVNNSTEDVAEARVLVIVSEAARVKDVVSVPGTLGAGWLEVDIGGRLCTNCAAGTEGVLKFVDGVGSTDVAMTEDGVRSGELIEVEVVMRAGRAIEEAGMVGASSGDETPVSDRGVWLVGDASSSVLVAAPGGPFWFPSGPGGPFLFPSRPGAFVFAGSRAGRAFRKDGGILSL
jgi:hypothetical protein